MEACARASFTSDGCEQSERRRSVATSQKPAAMLVPVDEIASVDMPSSPESDEGPVPRVFWWALGCARSSVVRASFTPLPCCACRLSFEAPPGAQASAEMLEKRFQEIALSDTRLVRLLTMAMSSVAYTVAVYYWPAFPMYPAALSVSLVSLLAVLVRPGRANGIVAYFFLPLSACAYARAPPQARPRQERDRD